MISEIINLLKEITLEDNVIKPFTHLNVINFELPLDRINFKVNDHTQNVQIKNSVYNENKDLFENIKGLIYSNFDNSVKIGSLSDDVYVSVFNSNADNKKILIEIYFN